MPILSVLDNEEVGSQTKRNFIYIFMDTTRTNSCLGLSDEDYLIRLADSFMISADNAHAIHPNHQDCSDPVNHPYLNGGIVIKFNANQKYLHRRIFFGFRDLCCTVNVPVQTFVNRSDMAGGSTLGNISNTQVAMTQSISGRLSLPCILPTRRQRAIPTILSKCTEFFS